MISARFWVGGTGTWDAATTTHWSATSGGAGGASVPGSSDTVTFNGSSGGGTVTPNFGGTITLSTLSFSGFTGTWNNSANNNNITLTGAAFTLDLSGTSTRTINLGSATYTLSNQAARVDGNSTNLTLTAGSSTIAFTGAGGRLALGGITLGTVTLGASTGDLNYYLSSAGTIGTVSITAPVYLRLAGSATFTITNAIDWNGTSTFPILIASDVMATRSSLVLAAGSTLTWAGIRDIAFSGSPTASSSLDLGNNTGITITPPQTSGGAYFSAAVGGRA